MTAEVRLNFEPDTLSQLEEWHESVRTKAITIIQKTIPEKVLFLNQKIAKAQADKTDLLSKHHYFHPDAIATDTTVHHPAAADDAAASSSSKKRKTADANGVATGATPEEATVYTGNVKASEYLERVYDDLRAEWDEMIVLMDDLKMFINLLIPRIEDGDTFGVSVQEEALNEVVRTQDSAYNLLATPFSTLTVRGDLAAKMVRYPGVEDYALALREHDRKSVYRANMQLTDTRNMYAVVLDILRKNISKISKPKSGNQMGSYG
ncbi:uncharacterized protein PFL1_03437 [Pseudozyma flocculosa PF-1]|uniref:Related to Proteasome activator complex subunit 3 n=2 Tax=Pseudozyma flocculosa TaxID=84751 RepID=A0A5C3FAS1_9BASI|nr:uncharacterized protein PFL1_03437 [Pseudozyma flocculosa PF-1]EPQ29150.1 hypothetical protein PFL1_03437 [Pseudozyma flocculosa PF-1]SPO41554.1 related to Proteasome activator complex subunit 3 [Pseudozyma flocculosa]